MPTTTPPFEFEFKRRNLRQYSFEAIPSGGILTAGANRALNVPMLTLDTAAIVGPERIAESCEVILAPIYKGTATSLWGAPWIVSAHMVIQLSANPVGLNSVCGIELGSSGTTFSTTGVPATGLIRLYANLSDNTWNLQGFNGLGGTVGVNWTGANPPFEASAYRLTIFYVPGQYVRAAINGIVESTITAAGGVPGTTTTQNGTATAGVFVNSFTVADQTKCQFHNLAVETLGFP